MKHDLSWLKLTKIDEFKYLSNEENYDLKHKKITIWWFKYCGLNIFGFNAIYEQTIQMSTTTFYKKVLQTCYLYYQINLVIWADQELRYW